MESITEYHMTHGVLDAERTFISDSHLTNMLVLWCTERKSEGFDKMGQFRRGYGDMCERDECSLRDSWESRSLLPSTEVTQIQSFQSEIPRRIDHDERRRQSDCAPFYQCL
jgi:hypothetical protein